MPSMGRRFGSSGLGAGLGEGFRVSQSRGGVGLGDALGRDFG